MAWSSCVASSTVLGIYKTRSASPGRPRVVDAWSTICRSNWAAVGREIEGDDCRRAAGSVRKNALQTLGEVSALERFAQQFADPDCLSALLQLRAAKTTHQHNR